MTLAEAVDLVARTILAEATFCRLAALRPDDASAIAKRLVELAPYPDQDAYDEARAFLAARAEGT